MKYFGSILAIVLFIFSTNFVIAQIPQTLSYQGVLTNPNGEPYPNDTYMMTFRLYVTENGGDALWAETDPVETNRGLFHTILGNQVNFEPIVKFDRRYWLGIQLENEQELTPRIPLTSVAYSFNATRADTANVALNSIYNSAWMSNEDDTYLINGNIGIGTASPSRKLHIKDTNYVALAIENENSAFAKQLQFRVNNQTRWYFSVINEEIGSDEGSDFYLVRRGDNSAVLGTPLFIERATGNIGIETTNPTTRLDVNGGTKVGNVFSSPKYEDHFVVRSNGNLAFEGGQIFTNGDGAQYNGIKFSSAYSSGTPQLRIGEVALNAPNTFTKDYLSFRVGNVGIGTTNPLGTLDVLSGNSADGVVRIRSHPSILDQGGIVHHQGREYAWQEVAQGTGTTTGSLSYHYVLNTSPETKVKEDVMVLNANGTVSVKVLQITGGADLAEPFEMSDSQKLKPGTLVVIDEVNPGKLKMSNAPYDRKVAGIISGAGGIEPGLTLSQDSIWENGQNVALTGRVYAMSTTENGPIKPGDLLTTSNIPGHAMRIKDNNKAQGAIIGKAMTSLESGRGLVLVLVTLQ